MHELRRDPLLGAWVVLTPGAESLVDDDPPGGAEACPMCPGNEDRTGPEIFALRDPEIAADRPGWWIRVFRNRTPILSPEGALQRRGVGLYDWISGTGCHEIVVETPEHDRDAADLDVAQIREILWTYKARFAELKQDGRFRYVTAVKNHGLNAGTIGHHAHSHIIATPITPKRVKEEFGQCREYYRRKERCLLCDILYNEQLSEERLVEQDERFLAFCPYAPRFPYEVILTSKQHHCQFDGLEPTDIASMAVVLKRTLQRIRAALGDVPYTWVLHDGPNLLSRRSPDYWRTIGNDYHWRLHLFPVATPPTGPQHWQGLDWPQLGFEWGLDFYVTHVKPEEAARHLRAVDLP